jgi:CRISPR-associated protein Cas1
VERKALYVTQPGARVQVADGLIAVAVKGTIVERFPSVELQRVLLFGNVQVTTQAAALLLRHAVHVAFFSGSGRYRGQLVGPESGSVFLRLAQHARHADHRFRLDFARHLVAEKCRAGRTLLRRYARNHPDVAAEMDRAALHLDGALDRLADVDSEEMLRGVEGAAAAAYFTAFDRMIRPPFVFERRSKHPAHNATNALLNLGYVLLGNEIASRLEAAGFDPRIGYFHGLRYGRSSLALDLLEPHRTPVIDRLTLSVLNRRMFSPDEFEDRGAELGVRLVPAALRRYLSLYEASLGDAPPDGDTPRARIQQQVDRLRRAVMAGAWDEGDAGDTAGVAGSAGVAGMAGSVDVDAGELAYRIFSDFRPQSAPAR